MKACKALSLILLVLLWSGTALAQDPVKVDAQHYKVVFENTSVRVLKISYPPGGKSVMHQHPESIVVPLCASQSPLQPGRTASRRKTTWPTNRPCTRRLVPQP